MGHRLVSLLLAFCALAVVALVAGPFIYHSLLPTELAGGVQTGCSYVLVSAILLGILVASLVWQMRRPSRPPQIEMDRRLWRAHMGEEAPPPEDDEG